MALYKTYFNNLGIFSYPGMLAIRAYDQFGNDLNGNGIHIREKYFNLIPEFYSYLIEALKTQETKEEEFFNELIVSFLDNKLTLKR